MTPTPVLGAFAGAALVAGVVLIAVGLIGTTQPASARPEQASLAARTRHRLFGAAELTADLTQRAWRLRQLQYSSAVIAGSLVWLVSRWPVAGIIVAAVIAWLPAIFRTGQLAQRSIVRLEALESWTRRLGDLRAAGTGLEQSLTASVRTCPEAIRPEVNALAARLQAGWSVEEALAAFGDDLNHPAADLVVAVLVMEAERRGAGVARVLTDLAEKVAEEVAMRRKVEADRAKPRTTARWITVIALCVAGVGALNRSYVAPYGTAAGQLVLAALAIAFAGCLWWMRILALGRPEPRLITKSRGFSNSEGSSAANSRGGVALYEAIWILGFANRACCGRPGPARSRRAASRRSGR